MTEYDANSRTPSDDADEEFRICRMCGGRVSRSGICHRCNAVVYGRGWRVEVHGKRAKDVKEVAEGLSIAMGRQSPWLSGLFYVVVLIAVGMVFLVFAQVVNAVVLPFVIVASLLGLTVIGTFQLRQDKRLSEKGFLSLMSIAFKQLPVLMRGARKKEVAPRTPN